MDGPHGLGVTARDLGVRGPRGWAFRGVRVEAGPGSLIALEGPSGSGRTCLLLTLTGRMRPTEGQARVGGFALPRRMSALRRVTDLAHVPGVTDLAHVPCVTDLAHVPCVTDLDPALTVGGTPARAGTAAAPLPGLPARAAATACGADAACADLEKAAEAAVDGAAVADDVDTPVADQDGGLKELDGSLAALRKQAQALADRAPHLSEDLDDAVTRINELNEGAGKVAAGARRLHQGLGTAKTGAAGLDEGVAGLRTGAEDLSDGMYRLVDGAGKLADGLHDGAERIPGHDEEDRARRTEVMAGPVRLVSEDLHEAPDYGTGFAPYFVPLSLWVGAMVAYMLIPPMNRRALAAGALALTALSARRRQVWTPARLHPELTL
ncbi:hypothetical protein GCM10010421_59290 [Streptomyces glaucus]|uniref:ABC transporter domain-containing protein n=1 Tax=Streptomyces glaucus TaxID=284029 RepID=A0ABN3KIL1_9ACTN